MSNHKHFVLFKKVKIKSTNFNNFIFKKNASTGAEAFKKITISSFIRFGETPIRFLQNNPE